MGIWGDSAADSGEFVILGMGAVHGRLAAFVSSPSCSTVHSKSVNCRVVQGRVVAHCQPCTKWSLFA